MTGPNRRFGVELRASYYGPARIRLLVALLVVFAGLTTAVVVAVSLGIGY